MSDIANYFKKVFTDPKSMFFVAIGLMLLIVAGIAINDASDCQALKSDVIDRIKAINYAMIVIGFLFIGVGIARSSKHSFIVDYIEIVCGILGVAVFICGLLFLTTANDIICPTAVTTCAHVQWVTGLIISLGSVYFWYNKNKGSFSDDEETDSDKKGRKIVEVSVEDQISDLNQKIKKLTERQVEATSGDETKKMSQADLRSLGKTINNLINQKTRLELGIALEDAQEKEDSEKLQAALIKSKSRSGQEAAQPSNKQPAQQPLFGQGFRQEVK